MSKLGIKVADQVIIVERRGGNTFVHHGLVITTTMQRHLAGSLGEPGITAVIVNPDTARRHADGADWQNSLVRVHDAVHCSHQDWQAGRTAFSYEQIPSLGEIAARTAHEANRILCLTLGDTTQPTWANAPEWQRISAIAGASHILNHPDTRPDQSHESWMAQKIADGWVYGEVKDEAAKTHPCIMPYADLPPSEQMKDWMFGAVTRGVLNLPQIDTYLANVPASAVDAASQQRTNPEGTASDNQIANGERPQPAPAHEQEMAQKELAQKAAAEPEVKLEQREESLV